MADYPYLGWGLPAPFSVELLREHRAAQRKSWRDVARAKTLLAP